MLEVLRLLLRGAQMFRLHQRPARFCHLTHADGLLQMFSGSDLPFGSGAGRWRRFSELRATPGEPSPDRNTEPPLCCVCSRVCVHVCVLTAFLFDTFLIKWLHVKPALISSFPLSTSQRGVSSGEGVSSGVNTHATTAGQDGTCPHRGRGLTHLPRLVIPTAAGGEA